ncbi:Trk system potassium transporter TrkA [Pseudobacteriovorax antillogorgiicola]|uniref:Trk system potassium uptake protein TrkA n=1 Tax=Pseudobacteriovorax antillogorgiicola TaxID=1513793 RepID=A0A1Y6BZ04_9BACT|nr:Trk system potassium transporter TrkA [Pseudobacteriovorax antillogorgiicola]TCS53148.1 trk system potassium uptake protein TrkA [Pseudobacteriovorax antillogorgiicola]SMF25194.1 trk system potassium uptake protein TrkA [Pseudobacteriovorax antillogorgiicola]
MKQSKEIVISGAGEVGSFAAQLLSENGHSVTVIDENADCLERLSQVVEAKMVLGSSCHAHVLSDAKVHNSDVMIAATSLDEINLLSGALGKQLGARKVISRIHNRNYRTSARFNYAKGLGIDHLIYPEELTARSICSHINDPGVMAIQSFARDQIELHQYRIDHNSKVANLPLRHIKLPEGLRIIKLRRDGELVIPNANTELLHNDIVTMIGPRDRYTQIKGIFSKEKRKSKEIAIAGGSSTAEWVIAHLKNQDISIRLFEQNLERANELAANYPKVTVLAADTLDIHTFESEHLERCAALLSLSDNQERNILVALQSKKLGVESTFAVIHNSTYLSALEEVGIDFCYSPRMEAAKELLRLMDDSPIKTVTTLGDGSFHVYEMTAKKGSAVGFKLEEVSFPQHAFVAAIQRSNMVFTPKATDCVFEEDILIVIGPEGIEPTLMDLYG